MQSDIYSRTGSSHSGSPQRGPGCPHLWPAAPPKQGPGLNLPRQGWPWATFGLGFLTSDFLPWVPFRPLPPAWCHVSTAIFPALFARMKQNCLLSPIGTMAPSRMCPAQAVFCPSPPAKALSPFLMVKDRIVLQGGPRVPAHDEAIPAFYTVVHVDNAVPWARH